MFAAIEFRTKQLKTRAGTLWSAAMWAEIRESVRIGSCWLLFSFRALGKQLKPLQLVRS